MAFDHAVGDDVQGRERENVKVIPADLDVIDPGIAREAKQLLSRAETAVSSRFIDKQGLAPSHEEPTKRIDPHGKERFLGRGIEPLEAQLGIDDGVIESAGGTRRSGNRE